jgi:hypothetical protein
MKNYAKPVNSVFDDCLMVYVPWHSLKKAKQNSTKEKSWPRKPIHQSRQNYENLESVNGSSSFTSICLNFNLFSPSHVYIGPPHIQSTGPSTTSIPTYRSGRDESWDQDYRFLTTLVYQGSVLTSCARMSPFRWSTKFDTKNAFKPSTTISSGISKQLTNYLTSLSVSEVPINSRL